MVIDEYLEKGIILSRKKARETDLILKILTETRGVKIYIVFAGLKSRKRIGGKAEKYSLVNFHAKIYPSYESIEEITLLNPFSNILNSMYKIAIAETLVEIISKLLPENHESKKVFEILANSFSQIEKDPPRIHLCNIIFNILKEEGYITSPDRCAVCGEKLPFTTIFIPQYGFICEKCSKEKKLHGIKFTEEDFLTIEGLKKDSLLTLQKLFHAVEAITERKFFSGEILFSLIENKTYPSQ